MLLFAFILFGLAGVLGVVLLLDILRERPTKKLAAFAHGAFASLGLALLLLYSFEIAKSVPRKSLIVFALAVIAGIILLIRDMKGRPGPKSMAIIHGLLALSGSGLLLLFALN